MSETQPDFLHCNKDSFKGNKLSGPLQRRRLCIEFPSHGNFLLAPIFVESRTLAYYCSSLSLSLELS